MQLGCNYVIITIFLLNLNEFTFQHMHFTIFLLRWQWAYFVEQLREVYVHHENQLESLGSSVHIHTNKQK